MNEWVYKATRKKRNQDNTFDLTWKYKFLCRSTYENEDKKHPSLVHEVAIGNIIHFYYKGATKVAGFGSYRVVDGSELHGRFSAPIGETALVSVLEEPQNAARADVALFEGVRRGLKLADERGSKG